MFIDQRSPFGYKTGNKREKMEYLKAIDPVVPLASPRARNGNCRRFSTVVPWLMDSLPVSGQAPWLPESSKKNFLLLIIPPMCRGFFMILDFPCNGQRKFLRRQIRQRNRVGSAINTRILKKSPFRRSSDPLRGRSKFPARPHALQNMVTSRLPTGNTVNWATQYAQDLRNNRALLCSISLSISDSLQCSYISDISRTYCKGLLPKKNLFDSRQCSIPQRSGSMELVLRTPGVYRSVQSSSVFSGVQCNRESLASYTTTRHTQSILLNTKRALFNFNFDLPKHPNESIANSGLFISISIIYYVALFIQWYIVNGMTRTFVIALKFIFLAGPAV